jgi:hypothetical protein
MKWKEHTNAVCEEGEKIITAEVVNKPHFKLRDPIAYDVCINVLDPISRAWDSTALTGQGRSRYALSELVNTVEWLVEEGKPAGDMPALEEERKREEKFLTSRREAKALCEKLRAQYKRWVTI